MPNNITRTWSVPTSPRSPYKLQNTMILIEKFEGKLWNKAAQLDFAKELETAEFYEGAVSQNHPDFAARDRVNRSPKTFGFVRLGRNRPLEVTPAGKQLISGRGEEDLFLRQLLKWQYPSPNHDTEYSQTFCIRPFLELLRLVFDLDGLSKDELMLWGVPLIRHQNYQQALDGIKDYRAALKKAKDRVARGELLQATKTKRAREVYADEISEGATENRNASKLGHQCNRILARQTQQLARLRR